ncbi:hypothetical protein L917_08854 [Phytophthora nicotianae]|uniref:Uncharacterized protein n=1 Tax=Phytophthora nicotianae TaxID=4792 RepID=W2L634_PHYNI|nr:hypothetical protein L917_08854 [Phytophthora nicotianae]
MKCADPDCTCAELTTTDPCIVCGRGVHHICSNELYDSGKLSERFCSAACVYQWKTVISPPSSAADSDIEPRESLGQPSQVSQLSVSQEAFLPLTQPTQAATTPSVTDLTEARVFSPVSSCHSSPSSGVDAFGIPLGVVLYRQENCRHEVWDVAHRLATPFVKTRGRDKASFSHVCLLCAQELTCRPYASARAWEGTLHRWTNTSNAKARTWWPLTKTTSLDKLRQAQGWKLLLVTLTKPLIMPVTPGDHFRRLRMIARLNDAEHSRSCGPPLSEISASTHWLISSGLAYNTVASEGFKLLVQRLTGNLGATILAA